MPTPLPIQGRKSFLGGLLYWFGVRWLLTRRFGRLPSVAATLALMAVGVGFWMVIVPRRPTLGPAQEAAASDAVGTMVDDIESAKSGLSLVAVLPLSNDPSSKITDMLRDQISARGLFVQKSSSASENLRDLLRLDRGTYSNLGDAVARGRSLHAEGVLFGTVTGPIRGDGATTVKVDYTLARVVPEPGLATAMVFHSSASSTIETSIWNPSTVPVGWRVLSWIGLAVLLPLLTLPVVRPIVRRRSNSGNLFLLLLLTAISGISAFWMVGGAVGGLVSAAVFFAATVLGFMINLGCLNFALQLEK